MSAAEVAALLPDFEVIELLGQGGMGAVYKARQPRLNRFVAIKVLTAIQGPDRMFEKRFEREAQALAALNHPHVVTIHDFGVARGLYYFVMEYVDGITLREMIRSGSVGPHDALALIPQICDALQYAHDQGFVHRDIKPGNILVNRQGRVKIADFGLAKLLVAEPAPSDVTRADAIGAGRAAPELTQMGQLMGTPQYMAPEQRERPLAVDHRADIYSLGVMFYEMLTGKLPQGESVPPSRVVKVDVRIDEVVLRAMDREPDRRYQHAAEIKTRVEEVREGSEAGPAPAFVSYFRNHRLLGAAAALALAGLVLAGWMALARGGSGSGAKERAAAATQDLFSAALAADAVAVRRLLRDKPDVDRRDADGNTPLHVAARAGAYDCFKLLVDAGADVKAVNAREETALHLAASGGRLESGPPPVANASDESYLKLMTHLVNAGVDVNAWTADARMPIHYAAFGGRPALVDLLIRRGAIYIMPDARGSPPLLDAARAGSTGVVAALIARGVVVTMSDRGTTALHWAAANNDVAMAELLLKNGANANAQDPRSETPLHWAAQRGHAEVIRFLAERGANMESRNVQYQTALHLAVQSNQFDSVKVLCTLGANLNARALDARRPLDIARDAAREDMVRYLEDQARQPKGASAS